MSRMNFSIPATMLLAVGLSSSPGATVETEPVLPIEHIQPEISPMYEDDIDIDAVRGQFNSLVGSEILAVAVRLGKSTEPGGDGGGISGNGQGGCAVKVVVGHDPVLGDIWGCP